MNIITIDCGASFIKGALFIDGVLTDKQERKSPSVSTEEDLFSNRQITQLVEQVDDMLKELSKEVEEYTLCISNEMHGFLLTNQEGIAVTDYISWQKEYGSREIGEGNSCNSVDYIRKHAKEEDLSNTGMPLRAGLPTSNLVYLVRSGLIQIDLTSEEKELDNDILSGIGNDKEKSNNCEADKKRRLTVFTLGDYIVYCLTKKIPFCHPTNAAASGFYDLRTGDWNWNYIHDLGLDGFSFLNISEKSISCEIDGKKVVIKPTIGDQQAALLGAGLESENQVSYNLGTGSQVSCLVKEPICGADYQIRPFFRGMYLKTIPHLPSGRALNVYIRFIKNILNTFDVDMDDETLWEKLLEAQAKSSNTKESALKCDMSFFENPITSRTTGYIDNIEEYGLELGTLMDGIFKQLVENYMIATHRIIEDQKSVTGIVFSGGVARKIEFIRDQIIKQYSKDMEVVIGYDETLVGLFKYGLM